MIIRYRFIMGKWICWFTHISLPGHLYQKLLMCHLMLMSVYVRADSAFSFWGHTCIPAIVIIARAALMWPWSLFTIIFIISQCQCLPEQIHALHLPRPCLPPGLPVPAPGSLGCVHTEGSLAVPGAEGWAQLQPAGTGASGDLEGEWHEDVHTSQRGCGYLFISWYCFFNKPFTPCTIFYWKHRNTHTHELNARLPTCQNDICHKWIQDI